MYGLYVMFWRCVLDFKGLLLYTEFNDFESGFLYLFGDLSNENLVQFMLCAFFVSCSCLILLILPFLSFTGDNPNRYELPLFCL